MRTDRLLFPLLAAALSTSSLALPTGAQDAGDTVRPLLLQTEDAADGDPHDYLPPGGDYDLLVPPPESVLGWPVGTWHATHDQLVDYFRRLAEASDRVVLREIGRTHEDRPQVVAFITSPENHDRLAEIRERHLALGDPDAPGRVTDDMPVVLWLGYSIHGNEPSGANASMLVAWHLAADRSARTQEILQDAVILIDPALNPDGVQRFSTWVNSHKGRRPVPDPDSREHNEVWPGGRTNHYWFDLNRDWLLLTHPESRNRVALFQEWRPNVFGDYHEMGTNATYFFQPGVPSRQNPLTPPRNFELTARIAGYHARALDAIGSLYYSEETFDDFYYGKGSTYPDIQGSVGILFEQASSRGHIQESVNGPVAFPFTIRNQVRTSLSTIQAGVDLREDLLAYRRDFLDSALREAASDPVGGYVFGDPADPARTFHLADILLRHGIRLHGNAREIRADGRLWPAGTAFVVPVRQPQYRLVKTVFETRTTFPDNTFYDVSTWNLPLSFGLPYAPLAGGQAQGAMGDRVESLEFPAGNIRGSAEAYAYVFPWDGYYAPRALHRLLEEGVRARVATREFTVRDPSGDLEFGYGAIVVPVGIQEKRRDELDALVRELAANLPVEVTAVGTGLTPRGIDLGSPSLRPLRRPRPIIVVGDGVSSYEAGQAWHLLDSRMGIPVSLVEAERLGRMQLHDYTHLILVDGSYRDIGEEAAESIKRWVREGGVVIAVKRGVRWVRDVGLVSFDLREPDSLNGAPEKREERASYADYEVKRARERIAGTIFRAEIDPSHPLGFGYREAVIPVFRNHTMFLEPGDDPFSLVARYTEDPLVSGYVSEENLSTLAGSAALLAKRVGRGTVILFADDPNFRGVWYGTNRLFLNALFFGSVVQRTGD